MATEPRGSVRPITLPQFVMWAAVGFTVGASAKMLTGAWGTSPSLTGTWIVVTIMVIATVVIAILARHRRRTGVPMTAQLAVSWLSVGLAAVVGGTFFAGLFLGYGALSLPGWQTRLGHARVVNAAIDLVLCVALVVVGHYLERQLRVPPESENDADSQMLD
ncbi:MAG: DUF3180 family protein [Propionibacteriaceae bacterium]